MEVDRPALRPTCCLSNALIRLKCEWTWHCDIKEFHSLDVSSSPYCINMPLMFHSDTGLFSCTSPITNCSDKYTDNDMIVNGIHSWFSLISYGFGESQNILYLYLFESTDTKWLFTTRSKASKYVWSWSICHYSEKRARDKPLHRKHITSCVHLWPLSDLEISML